MAGTAMDDSAAAPRKEASDQSDTLCAGARLRANNLAPQRAPSLRGLMKHHFGKERCDDSGRTASTRSSSTIGSSLHSTLNVSEHDADTDVDSFDGLVFKGPGCVRFQVPGTVVCEVPNLADIGSEQRWNTWWCTQEYQAMRLAAKYATKQIKKNAPNASQTIQQVFTSSIALTESKNTLSPEEFATLLQDPMAASPNAARTINQLDAQWSGSASLPCRGLEKYVTSTAIKTLRTNSMAQARKTAVQLYEQQRGVISDDDIAQAYTEQSRYAHLFARCLGVADQKAAERIYQEPASSHSDKHTSSDKRRTRSGRLVPARSSSSDEMSVCSLDSADSSFDSLCITSPANLRKSAAYTATLPSKAQTVPMPDLLDQTVSPSITGGNGRQRSLVKTFSKRNLTRQPSTRLQAQKEEQSQQDSPKGGDANSKSPMRSDANDDDAAVESFKRADSARNLLLGTFRRTDSKRLLDASSEAVALTKQRTSSRRLSGDGTSGSNPGVRKNRRSGRRSSTSDIKSMKSNMGMALKRHGSSRRLSEDAEAGSSNSTPSFKRHGSSRRLSEDAEAGSSNGSPSIKRHGSSRRLSEDPKASLLKRHGSSRRLSENAEAGGIATSTPGMKRQGSSRKLNDFGEN